jgi:hypothetical protein
MIGKPRPLSALLIALAAPIIWFTHFIGLYLAEAFLCTGPAVASNLRVFGGVWTTLALATLLVLAIRERKVSHHREGDGTAATDDQSALVRPLTLLSILAVLWTSGPLFALPGCTPAG